VTRLLRALVVVGGDARRGRAARGAATGVHATRDATCMATPIRARVAVTRARREIGLICSRSKHVHVLGRDERERERRDEREELFRRQISRSRADSATGSLRWALPGSCPDAASPGSRASTTAA
jgi:hypothetical protein